MIAKSPHVIWASVAIIAMLVIGAVTLSVLDKDFTVILTLAALVAVPVLGGFGVAVYQKLDAVKEHVNGNSAEMMQTIKELNATVKELALQVPTKTEEAETTQILSAGTYDARINS